MRKPKPPPASPDAVEAAFDDALQTGDMNKLMACWSDQDEMVCIHPGSAGDSHEAQDAPAAPQLLH